MGGYWSLGDRGYSPFQGGTDIFSFKDDLVDLIRGKHEIHAGIDLRANQMNVGTEAFQDGFWIVGLFGDFSGYTCPPGAANATTPRKQSLPRQRYKLRKRSRKLRSRLANGDDRIE